MFDIAVEGFRSPAQAESNHTLWRWTVEQLSLKLRRVEGPVFCYPDNALAEYAGVWNPLDPECCLVPDRPILSLFEEAARVKGGSLDVERLVRTVTARLPMTEAYLDPLKFNARLVAALGEEIIRLQDKPSLD